MREKRVDEWRPIVQEVLDSKVRELQSLGYKRVTPDEIWDCLIHTVWKKDDKKLIHQVVQDIFQLKSQVFMNYLTMQAYQDDDLLESIEALMKEEKLQ